MINNKGFIFNSTDDLLFLQSGEEWTNSVECSLKMCIQYHVDFYYGGELPKSPGAITSKTHVELNIYKYFYDVKKQREFFTHEWANKVLSICLRKKDDRDYSLMRDLIPDCVTKGNINKTSYDILKRSLKWALYFLRFNNAVLLPVILSFPKSPRGKNGTEPLFDYYPELMQLFRAPYCVHEINIPDFRPHLSSCGVSEYQMRDYAYKIITASTWEYVEDVTIETASKIAHDISCAIADGNSSYKNNLPIIPLLKLAVSMYPSRCGFNLMDIHTFSKSKRHRVINIQKTNTSVLCENHSRVIWESLLDDYIIVLTKKGRANSTIKQYRHAFNILMSYLYNKDPLRIIYPKDFTRRDFIGSNNDDAFIDEVTSSNNNVQYAILKRIDNIFNWISIQTHSVYVSGFSNPISKFDYPITNRPRGTNKIIPPVCIFIRLYSFLSTLCDFYWWLITNKKYRPGQALNKECYDTQELGMTPIVWFEGRALPIFYIPCKLTGEAVASIDKIKFSYPIFQTLFGLFVAMETGIRTAHIRWLSNDCFDEYCKNDWLDYRELATLPEMQYDAMKMVISSDKVKTQAWEAYVSTRVIRMMKRQKLFVYALDGDIPEKWYNESINSVHGKIRSLFHLKELGNLQGKPITYNSIRDQFKLLQFFFDLWQCAHFKTWLDNNIIIKNEFDITQLNKFEGKAQAVYDRLSKKGAKLQDVINETFYYSGSYNSEYTPHGIRASVVSQRVTLLPPDIIARYITGHETVNSLSHYVVLDDSMLKNVAKADATSIYKNGVQLSPSKSLDAFNTDTINKRMHEVISKNPSSFYDVYSPVSFSREPDGNEKSTKLKIDVVSDASFFTTHICPYNKNCPDDVVKTTGRYQCGQCYASIKTISHIPRILAHMRSMNLDLSVLRNRIETAIADGADREAIAPLDYEYRRLANELAAWIHTYGILKNNFENKDAHDKYFVANPELVSMRIMENEGDRNELSVFILMLNDAQEFVEYHTPNLRAQVMSIASKIKMHNQAFSNALSRAGDYSILDELRGLIKSCSDVHNIGYTRALEMLLTEQPAPVHIQLE
ncbi:MAG: hypothetical protein RR761_07290 [Aeromonas sp.]|uniref:hypothetical protein n=1 Tax=Aeromonas sp. TaxID=647 RepID=UPI002FC80B9D